MQFTQTLPLAMSLACSSFVVVFLGVWWITQPEPHTTNDDRTLTNRKIARIALPTTLVAPAIGVLRMVNPLCTAVEIALVSAAVLAGLIWAAGAFAALSHFHELALRIPNAKLTRRSARLRWYFPIAVCGTALAHGIEHLLGARGPIPVLADPTGLLLVGVSIGAILWLDASSIALFAGLFTRFLTLDLRKALAEQSDLARQAWTQDNLAETA